MSSQGQTDQAAQGHVLGQFGIANYNFPCFLTITGHVQGVSSASSQEAAAGSGEALFCFLLSPCVPSPRTFLHTQPAWWSCWARSHLSPSVWSRGAQTRPSAQICPQNCWTEGQSPRSKPTAAQALSLTPHKWAVMFPHCSSHRSKGFLLQWHPLQVLTALLGRFWLCDPHWEHLSGPQEYEDQE